MPVRIMVFESNGIRLLRSYVVKNDTIIFVPALITRDGSASLTTEGETIEYIPVWE